MIEVKAAPVACHRQPVPSGAPRFPALPRPASRRATRQYSSARRLPSARHWLQPRSSLCLALVALLTAGAALTLGGSGVRILAGGDEAASTALALREAGYVVTSAERVVAPTFPGNDGETVDVPEGARLYRVVYRQPGGRYGEAYRLVAGPFRERWSFPTGR